jgi:sigma-B regulation protein RsbU (phosphoserine phosphatase)
VPQTAPIIPGLDISFANRPANTVAGDYYDVIPWTGTGRVVFVVADVAGKSIPAGLLMATLQASLKTLLLHTTSLAELVRGMNEYASAHSNEGRRFTTAFLADYDPATRTIHYVNAGHNAPILRRANGNIERLERGGLPFGITAQAPYEIETLTMAPEDMLLVFTDGVIEAVNERNEEFGEPRLVQLTSAPKSYSAQQGLAVVNDELRRFVGMAHQHDDMTCLLVKFKA